MSVLAAAGAAPATGRLSLTISLLVDGWPPSEDAAGPDLRATMKSFFDDVAETDRELFGKGCVLDPVPFAPAVRITVGPNVSWRAENCELRAELDFAVDAPCRAFVYRYADGRQVLSLSLDIAYRCELRHHLALAALNDALLAAARDGSDMPAVEFERVGEPATRAGTATFVGRSLAGGRPVRQLRWACAFEDETLFDALLRRQELLAAPPALAPGAGSLGEALAQIESFHHSHGSIGPQGRQQVAYDAATLAAWSAQWSPATQSVLFMSGFSQGVIDYLRQDLSEVDDGSDPLYPAAEDAGQRTHWLLYGNAWSLIEVVRKSRSVEQGRGLIGNCPYLTLVHLLALHNEVLADEHEQHARRIVELADQAVGALIDVNDYRHVIQLANKVFDFRRMQMRIFNEVEKHYHDEVFRYDTERAFFAAITRVRGIDRRRRQLAAMVQRVTDNVDEIAKLVSEREQRALNLSVSALAILSLFALALDVPGKLREWSVLPPPWEGIAFHASFVVYLAVLAVLAFLMLRTGSLLLRLLLRLLLEAGQGDSESTLLRRLRRALNRHR